ncbi:MAG: pantoate--beta-alanine ligase [Candidatus Zixiibacteriota bacterium]
MQIIRSISQMQKLSRALAGKGKRIGIVPTMGFLHEGHLSLIGRAKKSCDVIVVTIFVNPAQFAPNEDFARYPRDEKGDISKIKSAGGDIVFVPAAKEIYPESFQTYITVEKLSELLEGKIRPGHFRGVATIVAKLFNIVRPDEAVFGMKDFQQAAVLGQMTRDLGYPVKFVIAPTVREKDGLAMSSRNKYLQTPQARIEALCLYQALQQAKAMVKAEILDTAEILEDMTDRIHTVCPSAKIDYIAFNDIKTLDAVTTVKTGTVCSLAVRLHGVRLIDNILLK